MAQRNWTYYSRTGRPYLIQMYHGDESGHLMLFVNGRILSISFSQKEATNYSFSIEGQLLELKIDDEIEHFHYTMTPQPLDALEDESKTFDKHFWIPLIFLLLGLNLAFFFLKHYNLIG